GDEGLPGGVVSRHVVRAGESLQSIAAAYYGSPSYWYLIAEANGLDGTEELKAGTTLSIPNAVANSVNDKESYKVYSESEIIGSTSPEVRVKQKKKKWYQTLVQIIIAVIVVVAAYYVGTAARVLFAKLGPVFGALATAAVGKAAGVATSAVSQGLAIAVGLQEEFDWEAARDMGDSFALTAVAGGLTGLAGAGNTTAQVLSRGAVELGRQYIENDGKITNWSGVALKMIGTEVDPKSQWASTLSDINQNRKVLGAGLSVVEKFARGKDVNTLDWTNVAAAAIAGQGGVGHYADQTGALQWSAIARDALFAGGLSLVVGQRFGTDQAAEFFGSQLGSIATGVMGELNTLDSYRSELGQVAIDEVFNKNDSPYQRQQALSQKARDRYEIQQDETQAVAKQQQRDRNWMLDAPDEGRNGATTFAYGTNPSDDRLTITTEVDGLSIGEGLSQTNPSRYGGEAQLSAATMPEPEFEAIPISQTTNQTTEFDSFEEGEIQSASIPSVEVEEGSIPVSDPDYSWITATMDPVDWQTDLRMEIQDAGRKVNETMGGLLSTGIDRGINATDSIRTTLEAYGDDPSLIWSDVKDIAGSVATRLDDNFNEILFEWSYGSLGDREQYQASSARDIQAFENAVERGIDKAQRIGAAIEGDNYRAVGEELFDPAVAGLVVLGTRGQGLPGPDKNIPGLDWSRPSPRTGGDAAHHVTRNHGSLNLNKPNQGVFYGDAVETTNDAWRITKTENIQPVTVGNRDIYVVPRANSGYAGGAGGQLQNFDYVTLITEKGTNRVVTSFPTGSTPPLPKSYDFPLLQEAKQ
ncbi:MAG: LysM domain-containing protein, partial [Candidatus Thiodiazotropha endolucinida]